MRKRKKSYAKADLDYLSRFMGALIPDQKRLGEIQAVYDNLTLLGQLLGAGTDITSMRQDFQRLATVLLEQLAKEHYKKATLNLGSCAQVAIDVLTRNLFERTADIGFLATDTLVCSFADAVEADSQVRNDPDRLSALHTHFSEYVKKYSVYHNIILLSPEGDVLAQLDRDNRVAHTADPLVGEALATTEGYVEIFRPVDLLPNEESPLIYAYRVMSADGSHPVGVLCLCFRFQDECRRIFESLVAEDDWNVITLLDANNRVIASSDPYQLPIGARLEAIADDACEIIRFAGREYLATTRKTHPYQGYGGPGWVGHALAPLNHAFDISEAPELAAVPEDFLQDVIEVATLFPQELRDIPVRATTIQQELNRAVWNGNIWLARDSEIHNSEFAKVLLREIGSTGARTRNVFSESTTNLYKTVMSSVLFDCGTQAALAIDIMDRNLYERANDCRWWALTEEFRRELAAGLADGAQRSRLTEVLRRINGLYTVYSNLLIFDAVGRVVAVSNPAYNDFIGKPLSEGWVRQTLGLKDAQSYFVSSFSETGLYAGQPTYVFTAAIRRPTGNEPAGGIAIVFDAASQFKAMLADVLPRQENGEPVPGAFAVFASTSGQVISSTDPSLAPGSRLDTAREFLDLQRGEIHANVVVHGGRYYAVGSCLSAGYREYRAEGDASLTEDVVALVFTPLSEDIVAEGRASARRAVAPRPAQPPVRGTDAIDIASFYISHNWYGLRPSSVVAAVDADHLTPMPGTPEHVAGCLMFEDQAITVFDLSGTLAATRPNQERRRGRDGAGKRQILVLRSQRYQMRFGILVDNLGEIAEIASARIEAVPEMMADGQSLIESLVKPLAVDGERRILIVLATDKIVQRFAAPAPFLESGPSYKEEPLHLVAAGY
ncbi:MAG TPA: chemotaxis protein CheW [Rhodocyclaceae bacterium]|nr:chemotaxis protein CheW [Rhodocyclaceae bacterium]